MQARDFSRARRAVDGLTISTAALAVAGVFAMFGAEAGTEAAAWLRGICMVAFAGVAGFSLWVAQAATGCAQVLTAKEVRRARAIAWLCAVLTGLVSIAGGHLGYAVLRNKPEDLPHWLLIDAAMVAIAFVKPAMAFVIAACESCERAEAKGENAQLAAKESRILELERLLREAVSRQEIPCDASALPVSQRPRHAPANTARAAANALRKASLKDDHRPQREVREPAERAPPLSEDAIRETLAEMTRTGEVINLSTVAKRFNVPYSRVERSPGRHLIEAARKIA